MFEEFQKEMPPIFTGFCWQTLLRLRRADSLPTNKPHQAQCYTK
jgi:hypothetical protein